MVDPFILETTIGGATKEDALTVDTTRLVILE